VQKSLSRIFYGCFLFFFHTGISAQSVPLDDAIAQSANKMGNNLASGSRVAVVNCVSRSAKLSSYVLQEMVVNLVDTGKFTVVEREDLDIVNKELQYQLSGDVSDESAQAIGKILGAQVIITCALDDTSVLRVKAIAVETARILAAFSVTVQPGGKLETLTTSIVLVKDCEITGADASLAPAINNIMVSTVSGARDFCAVTMESRTTARTAQIAQGEKTADQSGITDAETILSGRLTLEGGLFYFSLSRVSAATGTVISGSTETYRSSGTMIEGISGQVKRCLGIQVIDDDRKVITVSSMTELIQAIGSDRIIHLAPGQYDLSKGYQVKNASISWVDEYDGPCPVVKSVSNMALVGDGNETVMIRPQYGWVMSFDTCSGIRISNLIFGHTTPGQCLGGVLRFKNCDDTEIRSSELYGSGTYGLGLERASAFLMEDCNVHDCTYGLATLESSSDVTFNNTAFRHTGEFELISVVSSDHIAWNDCDFEDNWGSALFTVDDDSRDVRLARCGFKNNRVRSFASGNENLILENARFDGNGFAVPKKK